MAINASWLASSTPLYAVYQDKTYFPILREIWPLNHLDLYPELQSIEWNNLDKKSLILPLIPYSPDDYDLDAILEAPSLKHPLGTDDQGRDLLSRIIHGSKISLSVGFIAVGIYVSIGLLLGALAGYFGGKTDFLLSRLIEIVICFPTFFLILTLVGVLERSLFYIMLAIGLTGWTGIARLVRGEFLKLKNQDFMTAARTLGLSDTRLIFYHLLPNSLAPVLVSATFGMASAILIESSLSFLGFGVPPPTPSWGQLLSSARGFMDMAWWLALFPGLAIFLSITTLNLLGEGLRDVLDPKLKRV
ncbi:MAG: ABC transporter permease [Deltaproteobacteria bacterium]|nr:ABC transporter permease [Deltaproteobacteria bacterium]